MAETEFSVSELWSLLCDVGMFSIAINSSDVQRLRRALITKKYKISKRLKDLNLSSNEDKLEFQEMPIQDSPGRVYLTVKLIEGEKIKVFDVKLNTGA